MTAIVFLLLVLMNLPFSEQLDYSCYPNGTLMVTNPDRDLEMVDVKDEFQACRPTLWHDNRILQLDGCKMDHYVIVMFFKRSLPPYIITGRNKRGPYKIMCRNLPPEGVEISVSVNLGVRTHLENIEPETTGSTQVTRIFSHVEGDNVEQFQTLRLDNKLEWVFEVAEKYQALPESCTAYSGRAASDTVESVLIMENGCPVHHDVTPRFERIQSTDATENKRYALKFQAFRFGNEPFITVVCSIRVCVNQPGHNCNVNCDVRRRRRRSTRKTRDSRTSDKVNNKVVVLEVLDDLPADGGQRGNSRSTSDREEEVWRNMLAALSSANRAPTVHFFICVSLLISRILSCG